MHVIHELHVMHDRHLAHMHCMMAMYENRYGIGIMMKMHSKTTNLA